MHLYRYKILIYKYMQRNLYGYKGLTTTFAIMFICCLFLYITQGFYYNYNTRLGSDPLSE